MIGTRGLAARDRRNGHGSHQAERHTGQVHQAIVGKHCAPGDEEVLAYVWIRRQVRHVGWDVGQRAALQSEVDERQVIAERVPLPDRQVVGGDNRDPDRDSRDEKNPATSAR